MRFLIKWARNAIAKAGSDYVFRRAVLGKRQDQFGHVLIVSENDEFAVFVKKSLEILYSEDRIGTLTLTGRLNAIVEMDTKLSAPDLT